MRARLRIAAFALAFGVLAGTAWGGDPPDLPPAPVKRNELPPGAPLWVNGKKMNALRPTGLAPADTDWRSDGALVPVGAVRVINRAPARLGFAFYDTRRWAVVQLDTRRRADLKCGGCDNIVYVQFHDGVVANRFELQLQGEYIIGWSNEAGHWVIRQAE